MEELKHIEAAKKDPRKFSFLYDMYYKEIFRFVNRRTDDEHITADLTQQVFLKAMQNLKGFEYRGIPFSAWLYRIASNEIAQHFRDHSKTRVVCLDATDVSEMLEDHDSGFEQEKREALFKAIKKLSPSDLEMIEMRFFEKRSFKEIADIKNVTENNAKVKTYRIIDKLKSFISVEI